MEKVNEEKYKYKFSFVTPIYNSEAYLDEMIRSIIGQSIGFQKNVQMVLVNDGSTDRSEEICLKYKKKYPNNIKYIKKENGGVSSARNRGLEEVEGEFIGFVDSDDRISKNSLKAIYRYAKMASQDVNVIAISMKNVFDSGEITEHPLNGKTERGTRTIDLASEGDIHPQSNSASAFFRFSAIKNHRFDTKLHHGEDGKFVNTIIAKTFKIGVVPEAVYYYSRHESGLSSSNAISDDYYFDMPRRYLLYMLKKYKKEKGSVPIYIQNIALYDLQWRIRQIDYSYLESKGRLKEYKKILIEVLSYIDDENIINFKQNLNLSYRLHMLKLKHGGKNIFDKLNYQKDGTLLLKDKAVFDIRNLIVWLRFIKIEKGNLILEGSLSGYKDDEVNPFVLAENKEYPLSVKKDKGLATWSLGEIIYVPMSFSVKLPISEVISKEIKFGLRIKNNSKKYVVKKIWDRPTNRFCSGMDGSYQILFDKKRYIARKWNQKIILDDMTFASTFKAELRTIKRLVKLTKWNLLGYRILFWFLYPILTKRKTWLISDREDSGGDNGDYFFQYAISKKEKNKPRVYFSINKESQRFSEMRMKRLPVISFGSAKHKIVSLFCDIRISSHFDMYQTHPFGIDNKYVHGLMRSKFVYLEHGVLASDLSKILNKNSKNISLITAASLMELKELVDTKKYGYTGKEVKITGHPRMDARLKLKNPVKKEIAIAPTWRMNLAGKPILKNGVSVGNREYSKKFKDSDYYKFYASILKNEELKNYAKKSGYLIKFYIHPSHYKQYKDFMDLSDEVVRIMSPPHDYEAALVESSIMITDYSGVAFDFAYLNKPVIYTQFDKKDFYKNHSYTKGLFDFEKHGFGPVFYHDLEAIQGVIDLIDEDAKNPKKYEKRVEKFFSYRDGNSAKRIYDEIKKLHN